MVDDRINPLKRALLDGIVPEREVTRTENHWVLVMLTMLAVMMAVIVVTGVTHALKPPSNVETVDPTTLHLGGEFAESNLGTAVEPDGSVTVRLIAEQYAFMPDFALVPADTPIKFRLTSTDVVHGFLLPDTNVNTMVVPGFIAEVRTSFTRPGVRADDLQHGGVEARQSGPASSSRHVRDHRDGVVVGVGGILVRSQLGPKRLEAPLRYALAVNPPKTVPAALNGFAMWNAIVLVFMLFAYGYPISQFFFLKSNVPAYAVSHPTITMGAR